MLVPKKRVTDADVFAPRLYAKLMSFSVTNIFTNKFVKLAFKYELYADILKIPVLLAPMFANEFERNPAL